MAKLRRVKDGEGFTGSRSEAIKWNEKGQFEKVIDHRPVVGCSMLVGSVSAGTYSSRDYWLTTPITEIIEDKGDYVKFTTGNSIYEWWE